MTIPKLKMSDWIKWENRDSIPNCKKPGVYVIAITNKDLEGSKPSFADVSYIGMTNSKAGLKGRWSQFNTAIKGIKGLHSGGDSVFKDLGHFNDWDLRLYVACMPIDCDNKDPKAKDLIKMGWVAYFEYELFAQFFREFQNQKKPKYNTQ